MSRRAHYLALTVVIALVLLLFNLPEHAVAKVRAGVSSLFLPLFGFAATGQQAVQQVTSALAPRRALAQQIEQLRAENQQLAVRCMQNEAALLENERLRQLLGWQKQSTWKLKPARVIARDTANWWRSFQIDRGSRDGVQTHLPILVKEGLVGKIGRVGYATSEVILVGDPNCRVSVVVHETMELGVLSSVSAGVLDHRLIELTHLPRNSALKAGQSVYTSGVGGIFPAGIPVGTIVDSRSVGYGLYMEARVRMAADSSRLQEVMVLFP